MWLVAMHHCGIEELGQQVLGTSGHQAGAVGDDGCSSHRDGDPSSHGEGQPCAGQTTIDRDTAGLTDYVPVLAVPLAEILGLREATDSPQHGSPNARDISTDDPPPDVARLSHCLFVAPNAPPRAFS